MERELFVADVAGMYCVRRKGRILYRLMKNTKLVPRLYTREQLRLLSDKATIREGDTHYPLPKDASTGKHERLNLEEE